MQANVISFLIDHKKLKPGVYLHEIKQIRPKTYITAFDLRFKKPNSNNYLSPIASHSLEHIIATYYSKYYPNKKIYFGPMGCLTGFYLLLNGKLNVKQLINTFKGLNKFINSLTKVPAKSINSCGNYKMLNLKSAVKEWNEFYSNRKKWGKKYPILNKKSKNNN